MLQSYVHNTIVISEMNNIHKNAVNFTVNLLSVGYHNSQVLQFWVISELHYLQQYPDFLKHTDLFTFLLRPAVKELHCQPTQYLHFHIINLYLYIVKEPTCYT